MVISDLRRRLHPQGNGLHGRGTAPDAAEHHAALVQGRSAGCGQAAAEAVATAVDDRVPDAHDFRGGRGPRSAGQLQPQLEGRPARVQQRRVVVDGDGLAASARQDVHRARGRRGGGGGGLLAARSPAQIAPPTRPPRRDQRAGPPRELSSSTRVVRGPVRPARGTPSPSPTPRAHTHTYLHRSSE